MPESNCNITQAVFFTVRDIASKNIFEGVSPQPAKAIIDYIVSRKDALSEWLNEKVRSNPSENREEEPIESFKTIPENVKENANAFEKQNGYVINNDCSLINAIESAKDLGDLQNAKASFMDLYDELSLEDKSGWELVYSLICHIPDADNFDTENKIFTFDDYSNEFAESDLCADVTHCDKRGEVKVKDRLGWYRKEDNNGNTVVCAVNPWAGDTESDHNVKWADALLSLVIERYKSLQNIILVCHDRDFNGFSGKDEVVNGSLFKTLKGKYPKLDSLIVFQHSNDVIMGALNKSKAADVYDSIKKYAKGFDRLKKADESNGNANAHGNYGRIAHKKEE